MEGDTVPLKAKIVDRVAEAVREDLEPGESIELVVQAALGSLMRNTGRNVAASAAASAVTLPLLGMGGMTMQRSPLVFAIVTNRRVLFIACRDSKSGMSSRVPVPGLLGAAPRAEVRAVTQKGRIGNVNVDLVDRANPEAALVRLAFPPIGRRDGWALAELIA